MGIAYVSAKCSQGTNKATITWDSNFNVTVTITSGSLEWRVRGRASDNDSRTYCSGSVGVKSGSFSNGTFGKTYIFQVYDTVEETYMNSGTTGGNDDPDTSDFTLTSGGSSGGEDDSGGGGSTGQACSVYISNDNGINVEVQDMDGDYVGNMGTVYSGDYIAVKYSVVNGYTLSSFSVSGATYISEYNDYKIYQVTGNVYIYASTESGGSGDEGGGSSGGDDSGGGSGSGSGGSNSGLKETEPFTAQGVKAKATYTSGPEVTVTLLSWSGYGSIPYWRIKGAKSEGDSNIYLEQNNKSSNSFNSKDLGFGDGYDDGGKNYVFQVCKNGNWNNDGGDASVFHVDFSLAGEGGGESSVPATLNIIQGEGTELTVNRIQSTYGSIGILDVNTSHQVWYGSDVFEITAKALDGYELNYYSSGGIELGFLLNNFYQVSDGEYSLIMDADASIATTATSVATIRIYNENTSSWNTYAPFIYDGSNWNRYRPYIYNSSNSSWDKYS